MAIKSLGDNVKCYLADLSLAFIDIIVDSYVDSYLTISFLKSRGEKRRQEN